MSGALSYLGERFLVDQEIGQTCERLIRLDLFDKRRIEQLCCVLHAQQFCPPLEGSVAGNFIVLHGLSCSKQACIKCRRALEFIKEFRAFLKDSINISGHVLPIARLLKISNT